MCNRSCFSIFVFISLGTLTFSQATYELISLGTLGGQSSYASAVNNQGQVVGGSLDSEGNLCAFYWDPVNGMRQIEGGAETGPCEACQINNSGLATVSNGSAMWLWDCVNGLREAISGGFLPSDMNDSGQIAGVTQKQRRAAWWSPVNQPAYVSHLNPNTLIGSANGINNQGQIIGEINYRWPVVWQHPYNSPTYLALLGPSGNCVSINDQGLCAGYSLVEGTNERHVILWDLDDYSMRDLGALGTSSLATCINEAGQVTGYDSKMEHAFLWTEESGMVDLNDLLNPTGFGWIVSSAWEINNYGLIAATAIDPDGYEQAVLLRPVPEPSMAALLFIAGCMLRKRKGPSPL